MLWYTKNIEEVYQLLEAGPEGLNSSQANARLKKYGKNELVTSRDAWWKMLLEPFRSVFVGILIAAAFISLISHELIDSVVIFAVIFINAAIFYSQQYVSGKVLKTLRGSNIQMVRAKRGGKFTIISSINLVPGDLIDLSEGERIPADCRLVVVNNLQVNESILTGESMPVAKNIAKLSKGKPIYERHNMVYQGTYVVAGGAQAIVVATGASTEFGLIAGLTSVDKTKSPLQIKIDTAITQITKGVLMVSLLVLALALARGIPPLESLRFVMSLAVSAVPEGLPVALTVIIVLGMRRMAKKNALARSFKAIEDIGLVTVIATDKTGTLTKNHLAVVETLAIGHHNVKKFALLSVGKDNLVDPLDKAIVESSKNKIHKSADKIFHFDQTQLMSGVYYEGRRKYVYVKGSPEHLVNRSKLSARDRARLESAIHQYASLGYRVLGVGRIRVKNEPEDLKEITNNKVEIAGLVAFADELRAAVKSSVRAADRAGIKVKLITGDHYETAFNIGETLGLAKNHDDVILGEDLTDELIEDQARVKSIFARILPKDKLRILSALKQKDIVAMTGDGVNDVPALANAHVGIAMGSGSDIAKDASSLVLLDDNFSTIIAAVDEGRKIYDNIRRMFFYLLSTNLGEVFTIAGALLIGLPLPVTAVQLLWINLVTDGAMVLPLGLEPAERDHMKQPPRRPNESILSRVLVERMLIVACAMAIVTLGMGAWLWNEGYSIGYIQTVSFFILIVAQWVNAFNSRSESESLFARIRKPNNHLFVGLIIAIGLQILVMFGPLRKYFDIEAVDTSILILSGVITTFLIVLVVEVHKYIVSKSVYSNKKIENSPRPGY